MKLLSGRPAGLSLVTKMLAFKRDEQGVVNYRLLTNHAKVWAAHSRPARSHDAVNYRARRLRGGVINSATDGATVPR